MGLFGILLGLALLVWLAYRGWSILLAPGAAIGRKSCDSGRVPAIRDCGAGVTLSSS